MKFLWIISFVGFALMPSLGAASDTQSPWVENEYVRTRLISSQKGLGADANSSLYVAWEIELKIEGWKTYWRSPGDAGKPTVFNWEGSLNVGRVDVYFPFPERFEIFDIQTFGYEESLILPIRIEPLIPGAPMALKVKADFMACKDICVPFEAEYELDVPLFEGEGGNIGSEDADVIYAQVAKIPGDIGSLMAGELRLKNYSLIGANNRQRLVISVTSDKLLTGADIIVEAAPHFRFDVPQKALLGDGTEVRFVIPVGSTLKEANLKGSPLTLTIMDGWGGALETIITLE